MEYVDAAKQRSSTLNSEVFDRGLVIALLNINSLLSHIDELRLFVKTSKIDILAIKLDSLIDNDQISIPGFDVIRRDRIFDVYGLTQLISEPTRITPSSRTLIDLCVTNSPDKIPKSGVDHLRISDH